MTILVMVVLILGAWALGFVAGRAWLVKEPEREEHEYHVKMTVDTTSVEDAEGVVHSLVAAADDAEDALGDLEETMDRVIEKVHDLERSPEEKDAIAARALLYDEMELAHREAASRIRRGTQTHDPVAQADARLQELYAEFARKEAERLRAGFAPL